MSDISQPGPREMHAEIAALINGITQAFSLEAKAAVLAIENGEIILAFEIDAQGKRYALATYQGQSARLYSGSIRQKPAQEH